MRHFIPSISKLALFCARVCHFRDIYVASLRSYSVDFGESGGCGSRGYTARGVSARAILAVAKDRVVR